MTNIQKWRHYCKDLKSPDSFIDMGFYALISSVLQRRVWNGPAWKARFANQNIILVGEAAVGKGLVITTVLDFLKFWKLKHSKMPADYWPDMDKEDKRRQFEDALMDELKMEMDEHVNIMHQRKILGKEEPLLFPVAADCTTFESFIQVLGKTVRVCNAPKGHPFAPTGIYTHKSISCVLEEMSSLFGKNKESLTNFFLNAWDCGDYKYETKNQGTDNITRMCVNIFGGTTPTFLQETFRSRLLTDGFASRTVFVFEHAPRFHKFGISEHTPEQKQCRKEILQHMRQLSLLFGEAKLTEEAFEFLRWYFEKYLPQPGKRVNNSIKLNDYYGRKDGHVTKLAMAIHFADKTSMEITKEDCEHAIKILDALESKMHLALSFGGDNRLGAHGKSIIKYLKQNGASTFNEIWMDYVDDLKELELQECLRYCMQTGLVIMHEIKDEKTGVVTVKYDFIRNASEFKPEQPNNATVSPNTSSPI